MESQPKMMVKKPFEYYIFKLEKDSIIPAENGAKKNQRFRCDICSAIFKRGFSLKRHYLRFHINVIYINERDLANCGITPAETTETGLYKCHDCSTHFDVKDELMDHRNSYHVNGRKPGGLNYFCDRCSMTFTNKHNFLSHVKRACQKEDVKVCPHCQKEYARKGRLEKHMLHCKTDCKKVRTVDPDVQVLKIAKPSVSLSLTQTSEDIDDDSKSVESGEESDNNSRCSLTNDFYSSQTYPDFKGDQDGVEDFLDSQYDFSQTVERYVRDADDKVYLVLDTAKAIYPSSDRPYDDPSYYETDYPFNLDDLAEEEKPQDDLPDEPMLTWQELKFSADSDSQDVFLRVRATYVGSSAPEILQTPMPTLKTYSKSPKPGTIGGTRIPFLDGQCDTSSLNSSTVDLDDSLVSRNFVDVNKDIGCVKQECKDDAPKPKINLDKLLNLIDVTSTFDVVEAPAEQFDLLNYTQEVVNQSVDSPSSQNWSQNCLAIGLKRSGSFEEEDKDDVSLSEPPSKRPKVEEEGRKNLFRSKHTCPECGKSFGKPGKMVSHRRLAHGSQGVKTTLDSFCKFRYLPLWSPRRDESAEPPPERIDPFSLEFVNSCCEENITVHMDGKLGEPEPVDVSARPVCDRLSWKRHAYLQIMTFDQRNQFLSDMVKFPLAEQFCVHSKLPCELRDTYLPLDILSSVGLCRFKQSVPDSEPQVFEGMWSMPKCFICRACGMRSKELSTYISHQTYSHPLIFCSHVLLDMKSTEVPRELWSDWALGHRLLRAATKKKGRRRVRSLAALAESVSVDLSEAPSGISTLRRLRSASALVKPKRGKAEIPKSCTKCKKRDMTQVELHGHIVECGKKLARTSCPERLGGSKSKKHHSIKGRHGMKRKIPSSEDTSKKKSRKKKNEESERGSAIIEEVPSKRVTRSSQFASHSAAPLHVEGVKQEEELASKKVKNVETLEANSKDIFEVGKRKSETVLILRKKVRSANSSTKKKRRVQKDTETKVFKEEAAEELQTPARNTRSSLNRLRLSSSRPPEEVEERIDCTAAKRNILPELSLEGPSAFASVPMDPTKFRSCPRCSKQFRYMVALRKHFEKCFPPDIKTETVEVTVSRGLSTDFKTIADEESDYIDLDTALELADAREDRAEMPKSEFSFPEVEDIPNSRLPVQPASRSLRDMSYEDRVALGRKLEEILEFSRQNFDIQMLSVLNSVKERALYLSLSCPICLRKYKYKLKFKRHIIEGLLYGCQKRKGDEGVLSSDDEGGLEPVLICQSVMDNSRSEDPVAVFATALACALYSLVQANIHSPSSQWVISRVGTLATTEEIETLLKKCNSSDLVPLCSDQQLQPLVTALITEKLSQKDKKRKHFSEPDLSRPRSAPTLRSYLRKQASTADQTVPSTSASDRERVLNQEVSAIILQQKYLNEPPMHPPQLQGEPSRPASESMLDLTRELTDEFILSQLAPLEITHAVDTSGDSGYATCNNSNDQFQMLQQLLEDSSDLACMPTLSPEGFSSGCRGGMNDASQFASDSPPVLESYQTALDSIDNFLLPVECLAPNQAGTAGRPLQN